MKQEQYEALCDMFNSEGWKLYQENVAHLENTIVQVAPDGAVTNDQWQYARGQIHQLRGTLGYENFIKLSFEEQEAEKLSTIEDEVDVDVI